MFIKVPPTPFIRRRKRRVVVDTTNHVVRVQLSDTDEDRVVVTVHGQIVTIDDFATAFELSMDGVTWLVPQFFGTPDVNTVVFIFSVVVTTATQWRVPHPEDWIFQDGEPLVGPFSGEIG
jgi:hypothetical protein